MRARTRSPGCALRHEHDAPVERARGPGRGRRPSRSRPRRGRPAASASPLTRLPPASRWNRLSRGSPCASSRRRARDSRRSGSTTRAGIRSRQRSSPASISASRSATRSGPASAAQRLEEPRLALGEPGRDLVERARLGALLELARRARARARRAADRGSRRPPQVLREAAQRPRPRPGPARRRARARAASARRPSPPRPRSRRGSRLFCARLQPCACASSASRMPRSTTRSGRPASRHFRTRFHSAFERKSGSPRRETKYSSTVW